jgi:hypothetical protein
MTAWNKQVLQCSGLSLLFYKQETRGPVASALPSTLRIALFSLSAPHSSEHTVAQNWEDAMCMEAPELDSEQSML